MLIWRREKLKPLLAEINNISSIQFDKEPMKIFQHALHKVVVNIAFELTNNLRCQICPSIYECDKQNLIYKMFCLAFWTIIWIW